MADLFTWVEIPVSDMQRAKTFYQHILGIEQELPEKDYGGGMVYSFFPADGALVKYEYYVPGQQGACVYLAVQGDLNDTLAKVQAAGGKVILPKIPLGDTGPGFAAQILDSEGNRLGLRSPE